MREIDDIRRARARKRRKREASSAATGTREAAGSRAAVPPMAQETPANAAGYGGPSGEAGGNIPVQPSASLYAEGYDSNEAAMPEGSGTEQSYGDGTDTVQWGSEEADSPQWDAGTDESAPATGVVHWGAQASLPQADATYAPAGEDPVDTDAALAYFSGPAEEAAAPPLPPLPSQSRRRAGAAAQPQKRRPRVGLAIAKVLGVVAVFLVSIVALLFGAVTVVCTGPFPTAQKLFVVSVTETSAVKFLANIYFTKDEVNEILEENKVLVPTEVTDTTQPFEMPAVTEPTDDIEIVEVSGSTFKGKMMIVHDPSRVKLATLPSFGDHYGKRVEEFVEESNAVAGINAGGFVDLNGVGKGGMPLGLLIKDGKILSGSAATECNVIGISYENRLIVGNMTGQQALDMNIRDGVYFEPTLIVNGTPAEVSGTGGGLNPRTAIGQRADGAMLLLVIDGRQPHSIGATLQDVMQVMLDFEAVNASNLDGGSSSVMVYEGEIINVCASLYGSRTQPAAFIVE